MARLNEKSVEEIEEERMSRLVGKKMAGAPPSAEPTKKWTPPPLTSTTTEEPSSKPSVQSSAQPAKRWQPPKPEVVKPPEQPKKVWKYQQKAQEVKSVYTGPPMDLSTRVNYLNSLYDQGSIDDKEYSARSADLQMVLEIVNAICDGNVEKLKPLLEENGHLLPIIFENESNALHLAVEAVLTRNASSDIVRIVLEHRSEDVNSVRKGYTPLLSLCTRCRNINVEEAIKLLIRYGADLNKGAVLKEGEKLTITPLAAALTGQAPTSLIKYLCDNGADPNTNAEDGPVLNWAIIYGKDEEAKIFLEHGANPSSREFQQGATCLASAVFDGKIEIVKLLLKYGADRNASIMRSQQATAKELCRQLKANNPNIAAIESLL